MKQVLKIHAVDIVVSGQSAQGKDWVKQTVVFKLEDEKRLAVTFFGSDLVAITKTLQPNQLCEVVYNVESREYNGKWYTDVKGTRIAPLMQGTMQFSPATEGNA